MIIIALIVAIAGIIGLSFYQGLIIQLAINWFIVPFTDFNGLPYLACVGISLLIMALFSRAFNNDSSKISNNNDHPILQVVGQIIVLAIVLSLFLGIMALVHLGL